jgi:hypothetical protein
MTEMVVRVARYLYENAAHSEDDMHWADIPDKGKQLICGTSRVVISAMREPTSAMIDQVAGAMYDHFTSSGIPLAPKDAATLRTRLRKSCGDNWRLMIDAALKE